MAAFSRHGGFRAAVIDAAVICAALLGSAACGAPAPAPAPEPDAPWPTPPQRPRRIASITEGNQRGVFHADDTGRIAKYEFVFRQRDGSHDVRYFVLYEYSDEHVARTQTHVRTVDGGFEQVREAEFSYDSAGLIAEQVTRAKHEVTGELGESTRRFQYDASGRLERIDEPSSQTTFAYDANGNVTQTERAYQGAATLVTNHTYERSFNPLAGPRSRYDGVNTVAHGSSPYNENGWSNQEPGKPPASSSTIEYELDDRQYPLRRTMVVTNAALPKSSETIVTEFEYAD